MKILLLSELYLPIINGVVTSTSHLSEALIAQGHEVRILSLAKKKNIQNNIYYNKAISLNALYPDAYASLFLNKEIYQEIVTWKPDVLHTQSEYSIMRFAKQISKKLNIPIVHTYHTSYEDYTHYIGIPKYFAPKFVAFVLRKLFAPISAIIAPTSKIENMLKAYKIQKPISIIPTGIDLDFAHLLEDEKVALKKDLNISADKKIFISLGRLAKEKNIEHLLEYIAKANNPDWILIICGGGPYKSTLEKKVNELKIADKVRFTGVIQRSELYKYYQVADIFVSASTSETQGLTYIEALANGTPLLCKYDSCLNEVLLPTKNGYFFNSFEEFEMNASILFNEISPKIKECSKRSVDKYSTKNFALNVLKIYEQAMRDFYSI